MFTSKMAALVAALLAASAPAMAASPHGVHPSLAPTTPVEVSDASEPIDVNRASVDELQEIPGIGPKLARRIVDFREEFGPFETVDDLLNVRGIGVKSLERIRPYVKVADGDRGKGRR